MFFFLLLLSSHVIIRLIKTTFTSGALNALRFSTSHQWEFYLYVNIYLINLLLSKRQLFNLLPYIYYIFSVLLSFVMLMLYPQGSLLFNSNNLMSRNDKFVFSIWYRNFCLLLIRLRIQQLSIVHIFCY